MEEKKVADYIFGLREKTANCVYLYYAGLDNSFVVDINNLTFLVDCGLAKLPNKTDGRSNNFYPATNGMKWTSSHAVEALKAIEAFKNKAMYESAASVVPAPEYSSRFLEFCEQHVFAQGGEEYGLP